MRNNCLISFSIVLISQVSFITSECPKSELLSKYSCMCYTDDGIMCGGNETFNLKHMFKELSQQSIDGQKHFKAFQLSNSAITQLEENFFSDITFDIIVIKYANSLKSINTNAFNGTNLITKKFRIINTPYENADIFETLSKMKSLNELQIEGIALEEVPSFAFKPAKGYLEDLTAVEINGLKPKKILNYAFFNLNSLNILYFGYSSIDSIQSNAFHFRKESNETLKIYLDNEAFNGSVLEANALLSIKRPVTLVHNCKTYPCHLKYLDENIFAPFFHENIYNQIIINGADYIHLDCNDCRSSWVKKGSKYFERIQGLKCIDEKPFLDSNNFKNCS